MVDFDHATMKQQAGKLASDILNAIPQSRAVLQLLTIIDNQGERIKFLESQIAEAEKKSIAHEKA